MSFDICWYLREESGMCLFAGDTKLSSILSHILDRVECTYSLDCTLRQPTARGPDPARDVILSGPPSHLSKIKIYHVR